MEDGLRAEDNVEKNKKNLRTGLLVPVYHTPC